MTNLIQQINKQTIEKPLIYFCREVERAIGPEALIENYHICCIEDSAMVDELIENGYSVFCLEKEGVSLDTKSTTNLIKHEAVEAWVNKTVVGAGSARPSDTRFFALTFLPTKALRYRIEQLGGELLGNPYELYLRYENKLQSADIFLKNGINSPAFLVSEIDRLHYGDIQAKLGKKFILQTARGHTGSGTSVVENEDEFNTIKDNLAGNKIKLVEYLEGETITLNVCIAGGEVYLGPLQYQISGIKDLDTKEGVTMGNDCSFASEKFSTEIYSDISEQTRKIAKILMDDGYRGLFGVDLMVSDNLVYIVEINARQTANIPFETQLVLKNKDTQKDDSSMDIDIENSEQFSTLNLSEETQLVPLALVHIAEFLGIDTKTELESFRHLAKLEGAQLFLRAKKDTVIQIEPSSGIYSISEDQTNQENSIAVDDNKSLIFQKPAYGVDQLEENSVLLQFQRKGQKKKESEEIARIQIASSVMNEDGQLAPWIIRAMKSIEEKIVS